MFLHGFVVAEGTRRVATPDGREFFWPRRVLVVGYGVAGRDPDHRGNPQACCHLTIFLGKGLQSTDRQCLETPICFCMFLYF